MPKRTLLYTAETVYGNHSFLSEKVALALEKIAYEAMIEYDLELTQVIDDSFRFKINNRYDLVFSEENGLQLVEAYDPEPYVSTDKIMKLYEKGLLYEMDRGVVSLRLKEPLELEKTFERYLTIVKDL